MSVAKHQTAPVSIYITKAAQLRQERIAQQIAADPEYQSYRARREQLALAKESNKPVIRKRPTGTVVAIRNNQDAQNRRAKDSENKFMNETFVKRPKSVKRRSIASTVRQKEKLKKAPRKKPHTIVEEEEEVPLTVPLIVIPPTATASPSSSRSHNEASLAYHDWGEPFAEDEEKEQEQEHEQEPFEEEPENPLLDEEEEIGHGNKEEHHQPHPDEDELDEEPEKKTDRDTSELITEEDPENVKDTSHANTFNVVRLLKSFSSKERLLGATEARKDLSVEVNPPIQEYIQAGTVPLLVKCLASENDEIVTEAAWALTNIASGTSEQTRTVIEEGAIPHLVIGLRSKNENLSDQCVWALGNIAGDSASSKQEVITDGAVKSLTSLIKPNAKVKHLRSLAWTISNLFRKQPTVMTSEDLNLIFDKLKILCKSNDDEVLRDAFWTISYIADDPGKADQLIEKGFLPILVSKLKSSHGKLHIPVLRAFGNLSAGTDEQAETIISSGALHEILKIMTNRTKFNIKVRKDATFIVANILAGNPTLVKGAVDAGCLTAIQDIVSKDTESDLLKEAGWCAANLSQSDQQKYLDKAVMMDIPRGITNILFHFENDSVFKAVCLEALLNIFTKTSKKSDCYKSMFHDKSEDDFDVFVDSYEPADKKAKKQAIVLLDKVSVYKIQEYKDQKGISSS